MKQFFLLILLFIGNYSFSQKGNGSREEWKDSLVINYKGVPVLDAYHWMEMPGSRRLRKWLRTSKVRWSGLIGQIYNLKIIG
ncbi:MAG: hypothetical protein K1X82_02250 [Bacteroidia bacterium]|nr:hypothetical protein [Bacteroidia bacterium]